MSFVEYQYFLSSRLMIIFSEKYSNNTLETLVRILIKNQTLHRATDKQIARKF